MVLGTTAAEKLDLGVRVARPLMRKILYDLRLARDQGITTGMFRDRKYKIDNCKKLNS